jgi:hypothetical protein
VTFNYFVLAFYFLQFYLLDYSEIDGLYSSIWLETVVPAAIVFDRTFANLEFVMKYNKLACLWKGECFEKPRVH